MFRMRVVAGCELGRMHSRSMKKLMNSSDWPRISPRASARSSRAATTRSLISASTAAEAAFQGFSHQPRLAQRVRTGLDLRLLGTDQLLPVSFDHFVPRTGFACSGLVDEAMMERTEMGGA